MLNKIKYDIILNLKNLVGPTLKGQYIVIECDDWGGIRMPSMEVFKSLQNLGLSPEKSHYHKFDTVESSNDLETLYDVLTSVKDIDGNPATMTPFVNVGNPNFESIKTSNYNTYHFEPFTETYNRYGRGSNLLSLWYQGIENGIFVPQSHGREHLSVQPWMDAIKSGNKILLKAFELGFTSVDIPNLHPLARQFRPEFFYTNATQLYFLKESISTGLEIFKKIFGYNATVFVPSNGVFTPKLEPLLYENGIKYMHFSYLMPVPTELGGLTYKFYYHYKDKKSKLTYYTRNCAFEPSSPTYKNINTTLNQIAAAFRWNKPAIISTHRVNFVGGLNKTNADHGKKELKILLNEILKTWPAAKFITSAKLLDKIQNGK